MKGWIRTGFCALCLYTVLFAALFFSKEVSEGIHNGIRTCVLLIIPSTFFFLILSELLAKSRGGQILARPFRFLCGWFRLPKNMADVLILSLIGGYPVGARILSVRVNSGRIDQHTASRMLCCCVHASPAFLYTGIGIGVFRDAKIGLILLIAATAAFLVSGFLARIGDQKPIQDGNTHTIVEASPLSVLLVSSVKNGVLSMALICGTVLLFAAILPIIRTVLAPFLPESILLFLCGMLEVCSGCAAPPSVFGLSPVTVAAIYASFSGVCVFLQIAAMLHGSGISMKRMLLTRILYTLTAAVTTELLCRTLPAASVESMTLFDGAVHNGLSVSWTAVVFLLVLVILLLFFSAYPATIRITKRTPQKGD